jgi:SAM-dependent methyltransferase
MMSGIRRIDGLPSLRRDNPFLSWGDVPHSVAPFVPTPVNVVRRMLKLAGVGIDDVVYDLGCGDGRILFMAVEEFEAERAVGYDINPSMVEPLHEKIENSGLEDRIEVVNANFFEVDLSPASVVTMYLTTSGNSKLRPKLEEELEDGARIVSHDFPVHNWTTDKTSEPPHYTVGSHKIYMYCVPEAFENEIRIRRSKEEEGRWKRIRRLFLSEDPLDGSQDQG